MTWGSLGPRSDFLSYPGGSYILATMFVCCVTGLLGRLGLVLGLRYALTGRGIENPHSGLDAVRRAGGDEHSRHDRRSIVGCPTDFHVPLTLSFLLAWLPAAIVLHLMWLGRPTTPIVPLAAI